MKAHSMWAFLILLAATAGLAACSPGANSGYGNSAQSSAAPGERPNIVFLLADDQRADSLSSAGHAFSQTPNIDQLASNGVRFVNAFTVEPICAPSRFAFLSGQYLSLIHI